MSEFLILILGVSALTAGSLLGYLARQSIAKRQANAIELIIHKRLNEAKEQARSIVEKAKKRAHQVLKETQKQEEERKQELAKTERFLREKERNLENRSRLTSDKEKEIEDKTQKLRQIKFSLETMKEELEKKLQETAGLSKEEAKNQIIKTAEEEHQMEILEKIRTLEREGDERYEQKAKEILATVIQRYALSQAQEITTSTVSLPNEDIKGRIIGKDGRNIRVLERLTGTEIVIDETPEAVTISAFNPVRRQVAKIALERLIKDGRIQPARIEKEIEKAQEEIAVQIKKAGEQAVFQTGILGLSPKLIQLLGRLHFRTSYGQNVLLHSIEVALLSGALAEELGLDANLCKRAGLLHDVGKSIDHQVEGSHVEIGIRILEKLDEPAKVIEAMRCHHGDYDPESIEAIVVQVADQISGARPGARKESLEEYLKRLENLEKIALAFNGIKEAYAIQAGRELRVFVRPEEIGDLDAQKMAKEIAKRIQEELRYPGEIKITLIREKRIVEYAK